MLPTMSPHGDWVLRGAIMPAGVHADGGIRMFLLWKIHWRFSVCIANRLT